MNKVLKKALGFAGALGLTAVMVLAAAPVQASDVDARIQVLERELVQLKQNQESAQEERALAAEMKGPSFKYTTAKGLTVSAADNAWSVNIGNRFQVYSTFYLTEDEDDLSGVIRIRRHRPDLTVTSQQGFYRLYTQYTNSKDGAVSILNGGMYVNFGKTNPWLPNVGYGRSPSFSGSKAQSAGRPENSPLTNAVDLGGQDRSVVLSWSGLPAMGTAKITHLNAAIGHDNDGNAYNFPPNTPDARTMSFGFGIQPLAGSEAMGGLNVASVAYSMGYTTRPDRALSVTPDTDYLAKDMKFASTPSVDGDHTFFSHGLTWKPIGFMSLSGNYATYEGEGGGTTAKADEFRLAASMQLWGPKSGLMGGGGVEGGISIAPIYTSGELDTASGTAEYTVYGIAFGYAVPGGWMKVTGIWDNFGCDGPAGACIDNSAVSGGDDSFNVFHVVVEYNF